MLTITRETGLSPEKIVNKAANYFGEGGLGLDMEVCEPDWVRFSGGGGYVSVSACEMESGKSEVTVEAREWEYQVNQFLNEL